MGFGSNYTQPLSRVPISAGGRGGGGSGIGWKVKELFFDKDVVIRAIDAATRSVLSRFGAFVRRAAKSSIRRRRRVSEPGQPPSSHSGLLRNAIFFSYDKKENSVVIGPELLASGWTGALEALEYGGESRVIVRRQRRNQPGTRITRTVTIAARPFMHPALNQELPKLPPMWRASVKP
jgi:hypothetical protein